MYGKIIFSKERALKIGDILVLGDLHIGYEKELFEAGVSVPSQTCKMVERIKKLVKEMKVRKILFLGDVKHNIPFPSFQEKNELIKVFSELKEIAKIIVVKGNHDGEIEKYLPDGIKIAGGEGIKIKEAGFAHGHAWIGKELLNAKYLFLAHEHPAIEFKDRFGYRMLEPCWIIAKPIKNKFENKFGEKCKIKKVIILPAFNHLIGGISFNKIDFKPLGPNTNFIDLKNAEIYLTDGVHLGKLKHLIE